MAKNANKKGKKKGTRKAAKTVRSARSAKPSKSSKPGKPTRSKRDTAMTIDVDRLLTKKRKLSQQEEFDVMKLVLDKFLWIGTALMGWGLYQSLIADFQDGFWFILTGALIMLVFAWVIIKEFERVR